MEEQMTETGSQNNIHLPQTYKPALALRQQEADFARLLVLASPASDTQCTIPTINILRLPDVMRRVGLKHAAIYQMIAQGNYPKQIPLGARAVGWLESEIDAWLAWRIQQARGLTPP
jgi:prophage regulatory protein